MASGRVKDLSWEASWFSVPERLRLAKVGEEVAVSTWSKVMFPPFIVRALWSGELIVAPLMVPFTCISVLISKNPADANAAKTPSEEAKTLELICVFLIPFDGILS